MEQINIGLLHTGLRGDELLIVEAAKARENVNLELIDARTVVLDPRSHEYWDQFDVILERCISTTLGNAVIEYLSNMDVTVVNNKQVMAVCNDKFQTSTVLDKNNVPTLHTILVFNEEDAKQAVERLGGYPVVVKAREGSWGRLMGKINDVDSLETLIDHKKYMGPDHQAILVQEYIQKPGRDIRAFVVGGETICAIYRSSPHWITNTARGGQATNCPVTDELSSLCRNASEAVGGGILAMDIFETDDGLKINEINHTMEFKNSEAPTGVSISGAILDYCVKVSKK